MKTLTQAAYSKQRNAGDTPRRLTPRRKTPQTVTPGDEPPVDVHTPEEPPPQYLENDWLERLLRIYRFTV